MAEKLKDKGVIPDELLEVLRLTSPGRPLRTAIDEISKAGRGALIVVGDMVQIQKVIDGGFDVNCTFSHQRLMELCKMDGAVVIDKDCKIILLANALLVPDTLIKTTETGTRHQAAERTAKQTDCFVIAISEKRRTVTLYYRNMHYVLRDPQGLLSRSAEESRMLEKHKEIFNELVLRLDFLELTNLPSLNEAILAIQRAEIIARIASVIKSYIIELGREGSLVKMQLKDLTKGIDDEELLILKDYSKRDVFATKVDLAELSLEEELIEPENILKTLGYSEKEDVVTKGYRMLSKTGLPESEIEDIIKKVKNLQTLMTTQPESLISDKISREKLLFLQKELSKIKENIVISKNI